MKHRIFPSALPVLALLVLLCGCRSGRYYQAQAAQSAREFLLANAPELTVEQVYFVKYNDPVLLVSPVLGVAGGGFKADEESMSSEQQQICVTWNIPGARYLYMVFGVSDNRMYSWSPIRLIRKDFSRKPMPEDAAIAQCRTYAVNSLYHSLSAHDLNSIRFTFPTIARSNFELNFDPGGDLSAEEIEKEKAAAAKLVQYTLFWPNEKGGATVFCGVGRPDMGGWKINFAGFVGADDLKKHTVAVMRTPDRSDDSIVPLKRDLPPSAGKKKKGK